MTDIEHIKREAIENDIKFLQRLSDRDHSHRTEAIAVAIDYLHSHGYFGGVPDGYVLVPKEPLITMIDAGELYAATSCEDLVSECRSRAVRVYKAMISAAPKGETK